ncbi:hypothetical protein XPA_006141 [Xanthoria parietina]
MVIVRFRHLSILSTPVPKSPHRSWTSATVSLKSSFGTNLFAVPYPSPSNPIRPKTPRINPAFRFIASDATVDIYINSPPPNTMPVSRWYDYFLSGPRVEWGG